MNNSGDIQWKKTNAQFKPTETFNNYLLALYALARKTRQSVLKYLRSVSVNVLLNQAKTTIKSCSNLRLLQQLKQLLPCDLRLD